MKSNRFFFLTNLHRQYPIVGCLLFILFFPINEVYGQACEASTPSYSADLTGGPDSIWITPSDKRDGGCCGVNTGPPDNNRCVEFWITLDPGAEGIKFEIYTGSKPTGSMFYQLDCGPPVEVGQNLCLNNVGPHRITFCKPGNNPNSYKITSIAKPDVTDLSIVSDACTSTISTTGYVPTSIVWNSISPGAPGQYNSYLSCTTGCESTVATYVAGAPASVNYQVCGTPLGGCTGAPMVCNTTTVNFVSTLAATILPENPTICFGGSSVTLTANPVGGSGVYSYVWNTGATTQSIDANAAGNYSVQISDLTSCPTTSAATIVTAYSLPIEANAGPDVTSCANNPTATLTGAVQMATGGIWSGGAGTYSPSNTSLNPTYTPTPLEITNGSVTHTLTTTGNGSCPSHSDDMIQTIVPTPIISANIDQTVCGNNADATLAGSVINAGGGRWSGGGGTFFPNDSTLNAVYRPSALEISNNAVVTLTLTSIQNGSCTPVADQMTVTIQAAPTANAGPDQTICANNPNALLSGLTTNATGFSWSGTGAFSPAGNLNTTYTATAGEILLETATVTLTATRATCNPVSDQAILTILKAPTVNAGPDRTVCGNNGNVILNGIITNTGGAIWTRSGTGSFSPDATTLNATYIPSSADTAAGSVTLRLTTTGMFANCAAVFDELVITYTDAPTARAGLDRTVCANNPSLVLNGSVLVATGGTWSGGTGIFSANANTLNATYTPSAAEISAGVAILTLTTTTGNGLCNPSSDQMTITITPAPIVNAGIDVSVCGNNATVPLNGSVSIDGIASTGAWTTSGTGSFNNAANLTTSYVPSSADTAAGTVTLTLTSTTNGTCIAVSDIMVVTITDAPFVNAGPNQTVCANNPLVTLNGAVRIATGGTWVGGFGTFNPDRNTLNATYTPTAGELGTGVTLTLTTSGNNNCNPVSDQMQISVTPPPTVFAGSDFLRCANNPNVNLNGSVTIATGGTWSGGGGTYIPDANTLNATYVPSAFETTLPLISLILTTTGNGNCIAVKDTVSILIQPSPIPNAGLDRIVCANNPNVVLAGSVVSTPAATITWTGGSGTYNANNTTLNATYTPSAAEILARTATLTLTANRNLCNPVTDQMTISITPAPIVNAGPDVTVCGNNATVVLNGSVTIDGIASTGTWTSTGTGTFNPNATTLNASYVPSSADTAAGTVTLTLTSTTNGNCIAVTDPMTITITDAPSVNAGVNQTVCGNRATVTLNGSIRVATAATWSNGTGTFSPNATTLNANYTPSADEILAGTVTLTLTTTSQGNCSPVSSPVTITITPAPVVNAGPDQPICANNARATLAGSVTVTGTGIWTGGGGIYNPNNTTLNASYTPTATEITNKTVTLTLTSTNNGSCNPVADDIIITITDAPTVNAGPDQMVCASSATVPLNGVVAGGATGGNWTTTGAGSFSPGSTALNGSYVPLAPDQTGSVTLTLTTTGVGNCTPIVDQMTITFTATPFINAGPDQNVCTNDLPIQLAAVGSPGAWSGGTGTFDPNTSALNAIYTPSAGEIMAQTVTLTFTTTPSGACLPLSDPITINIPPAPIVSAGADVVICGDVTSIVLNGSVTNAGGGLWTTTGTGTFTPNATTLNATYNPSAADVTSLGVTLTLTSTNNGFCSEVVDQMVLTITTAPTINAGPDQTICADAAGVNLNASVTVATGGIWDIVSGSGSFNDVTLLNPVYTPSDADTAAGTVTLRITSTGNGTCVAVSDQIIITITPAPTVNAGPDQTVCADLASTPLIATFTVASGGTWMASGTGIFSPNNTVSNPSYFPSDADTAARSVTLTFTTSGNGTCNSVSDFMVLTINPQPVVDAGPDQTACADIALVPLNGIVHNAGGGTWTRSGTGVFTPDNTTLNTSYDPSNADTTAKVVTLTLTSSGNGTCIAVADQMIVNFTSAPTIYAGPDQTICGDVRTATLNAATTIATGGTWVSSGTGAFDDNSILNPVYTASDADTTAGFVTLTITSTGNGTCIPVSDNLLLTIANVPIVDAGTDQTVCGDVTGINLNGTVLNATGGLWSGGAGTFSANANTLNATYLPTAIESAGSTIALTLTSQGNGTCNPVTDQVTITITPSPTIIAGPDQTVCSDIGTVNLNGSVTIATGGTWTSSGTGTFADANDLSTTYTPSATDISNEVVVLTLTSTGNGTCNAVNDQMILNITPAPVIDAGPDVTICADRSNIVLNGSVTVAGGASWTSSGTGTFSPDANTLNANYFPSAADTAAGTIRLVLTSINNGTCNAVRDTMFITITPAPVVNAGPDVTICGDVNSILLNGATVVNALGGTWTTTGTGSFAPNSSTINASYILSADDKAGGNVLLTLTSSGNGTCNAVPGAVRITITPIPTVDAGINQTVCATTTGVQLNGSVTIATGGTWSTASGNGTFSPDAATLNAVFMPAPAQIAAGMATIRLTTTGNGTCNAVSTTVTINITPAPIVSAGANQTVCASVTSVPLNGTVTNATGGTWTTSGTGTFADANSLSTAYNPSAADKIAGNITLTLTSTGNTVCSAVSRNVTIGFSPVPAVDAGPSAMCTNASGIGLSGTVTNVSGGRWSTSSGTGTFTSSPNILTPHYTPSVADQGVGSVKLYLTTTGNGPCPAAVDSILVGIQPDPIANAGADQIVCADIGTVSLTGIIANAGGGVWTSSGGGSFAANANTLNATYTLSAVDIANTFATLTLTTTGNGFCAAASDQMVITITPAPTVTAGPDQIVCADIAGIDLIGSVTTATGGDWTSSGTGSFSPDASTLTATYIPSAADTASGLVTLTLTTTGNGTCNPVSDPMNITITPAPTVNAGPDYTICGDVAIMIFSASTTVATGVTWTSTGTGAFNDVNASTTEYSISTADTAAGLVRFAATTTGNGTCNAQSDTLILTITPAPTVVAAAGNACADSDTIQLSGSITVASGARWTRLAPATGVFAPDDITLNAGYIPSAADKLAGVVTLVLTTTGSGDCNEVTDTITLNIVPAPVAIAGPDQTVCSNVNVSLNGSVSNAGGGEWTTLGTGTFPSGATTLNGTYVPSSADTAAGTVRLVLTTTATGFCNPVTDTLIVTFTPAPIADAGPAVICQSAGAVTINGIVANAGGPAVWSTAGNGTFGDANALSTAYTPGGADNPSVVITLTVPGIGTCNPATDNILINITTAPIADANIDQTVCADIASITLSGSVTNAGGGIWSTPNGTGTIAVTSNLTTTYTPSDADTTAGTVNLVLTTTDNGVCLPVTDTMVITITPAPTVDAGPASVCANAPPVVLNGTTTVATTILWSTSGDGTFGDATELSTTYNPGPSDLVSVTLTLTTTAQGTCNPVADAITLFIEAPPEANANANQTICADAAGAILDGSVLGATGGLWTTSGTGTFSPDATTLNATYIPSDADTTAKSVNLTLTTTGVAPCNPVSDDLVLTINPVPVVQAGADQTVCGDIVNINLNGFVLHAGGGTWSTPNGTGGFANANNPVTSYGPTSADTTAGFVSFVLTSTGMGTCNPVTDTMVVTITDAPFVDAGPPLICSDAVSIPLSAVRRVATGVLWTSTGTGTFAPNNISLNTNYIPSVADRGVGSVTLTITSTGNGTCNPVNDVISVFLTPGPTANAGADQGVCADALTISLTGSVTNAPGGTWTTMDGGAVGFTDPNALNTSYTMTAADTAAHIVRLILTTTGVAPCNPAADTVVVNITPAPVAIVNAGNDTTVCESNPDVPLTGTIANAGGGMWTTTNGTGIFTPNAFTLNATYLPSGGDAALGVPVELVLESTGNGICNPITDVMLVTINPRPTADAGINDTVCADIAGVPLNGILTTATQGLWITTGSGSFSPDENTLNATYVPSAADTADKTVILTLQTIDNGACAAAFDNKTITITPAPTVDAGFDQTTCADADSIQLSGMVTIASGGAWSIQSGTGSFSNPAILNPYYRFSDADTAAGSVTLRLTTTGTRTCIPVFDDVVITITSAPIVIAGPDQNICATDPSIALTGSVTVSSGAQWTSDGTGTYSPSEVALIGSYFTTAADTTAGVLTFVLTSTGNGSCKTVRDTMIVTIDPAPITNAGPDQTVCADIGNVGLNGSVANAPGGNWTTSGTGIFDPNLLNGTYIPSVADTANGIVILNLSSTGTVVCSPDVDNMRITITPAPVVEAGPNQTVCADITGVSLRGTVTIASGGVWTTSGTGTFSNDSSLTTTYTPSAADKAAPGLVTLTLTSIGNGTCNPVSDILTLTITPSPTANAGPNRAICADASSVIINGAVTVATGGVWKSSGTGSFAPNPNTVVVTYVPSAADKTAGMVGLTLTTTGNGTCNSVMDDMRLTIVPAPTVNAGPDQTICADSNTIQLSGSKTTTASVTWTTSGSGSFTPNPNTLTASYVRSAADSTAGIVNLRLTTSGPGTCIPVSDIMRINITPAPIANAGPDQGICADASVTLNGSATVATGGVWSSLGTGTFSPDPNGMSRTYIPSAADTTAGSVQMVLTTTNNGMCKPVKDTVLITIAPAPVVDAGGPNICSDVISVPLNGRVYNVSGGIWSSSGSGSFTPNAATLNGNYNPTPTDISNGFVILTLTSDGNGTCNPVQSTLNVLITPLPISNAGIDQRICRGASTVLIGQSFPDLTYVWYTTTPTYIDSSGIINVTANTDTSYVLTVTDAKGCSINDTVNILVVDPPTLNLADNYCFAFGTALDAAPAPMPIVGNFQWFRNDTLLFGQNDPFTVIDQVATYMIGYNYGSCSVFDTTDVTPLPVLNGADIFTCLGLPTDVITTDIPGATYVWNGNPALGNNDSLSVVASLTAYDTTTYVVTVTNTLNCQNNDTILVIPVPPPTIILDNIPSCIGDSVTINASVDNVVGWEYLWHRDNVLLPYTDSSITVNTTGEYMVTYRRGECKTTDTSEVTFYSLPVPNNLTEAKFCNDPETNTVDIDAGPATSYQWINTSNPAVDINRTVTIDDPGIYHVTLTNEFNCSVTDSILVRNVCPPRVYVSQAFIPDGLDPRNTHYWVKGAHVRNFTITIFNRWGEIIFHVENLTTDDLDKAENNWDGTYRGEPMPAGVYPYIYKYQGDSDEHSAYIKEDGKVVLIR